MTHQDGPYVDNPAREGFINLGLGQPSPRLLPAELFAEAARSCLDCADPLLYQYGRRAGPEPFREALALFLERAYGRPVAINELAAAGSISLNIALLADVFSEPGDLIACEENTYFLAANILARGGRELVGVPMDDEGLDVAALARLIEERGRAPALVYTIPTLQNPTGVSLSPRRREELIDLAAARGFFVLADEPYNLLRFDGAPCPALALSDAGRGRVISMGSFSKILAPGLRLGWLHAAPDLIERALNHGVIRSGGGLNPVIGAVVEDLMRDRRLDAKAAVLRAVFRERARALEAALKERLPSWSFRPAEGGYFLWVRPPAGLDIAALAEAAERFSVGFLPGARCAVGGQGSSALRLSFSFYEPDELREGARRLAEAARSL